MERGYEEVAEALHDAGFQIALLTTHGLRPGHKLPAYEKIWYISGGRAGRYSLAWWIKSFMHVSSWREWTPDIIFSVSSAGSSLCLRGSIRKKIIAQCHGTALAEVRSSLVSPGLREFLKLPLNALRIVREIVAYRQFGHVIAIGPAVQSQLVSAPISLPLSKTLTINNGVDERGWSFDLEARTEIRRRLAISAHSHVGIFAARLHVQKGADIAIRALSLVTDKPDSHLIICGDGPERGALEREAADAGVGDRVHFLGKLPQPSMAAMLSAADVFVFPTRRFEGLPLNILEALASGLPILTVHNSNVPNELSAHAEITDCTADAFATAWDGIMLPNDRRSKLTVEFTNRGSLTAYIERLRTFARENE